LCKPPCIDSAGGADADQDNSDAEIDFHSATATIIRMQAHVDASATNAESGVTATAEGHAVRDTHNRMADSADYEKVDNDADAENNDNLLARLDQDHSPFNDEECNEGCDANGNWVGRGVHAEHEE
jgi:hypothetical protein